MLITSVVEWTGVYNVWLSRVDVKVTTSQLYKTCVCKSDHACIRKYVLKTFSQNTQINVSLRVNYIYEQEKLFEPRREKTGFLHMRKQRRRSASR